mmetsp:Transcript_2211/g.5911  ORF Transcript_2211/g.5911 Transcript_2211/m.5911 type:complete len:227 (-) Transcript_2211:1659-2339(-)
MAILSPREWLCRCLSLLFRKENNKTRPHSLTLSKCRTRCSWTVPFQTHCFRESNVMVFSIGYRSRILTTDDDDLDDSLSFPDSRNLRSEVFGTTGASNDPASIGAGDICTSRAFSGLLVTRYDDGDSRHDAVANLANPASEMPHESKSSSSKTDKCLETNRPRYPISLTPSMSLPPRRGLPFNQSFFSVRLIYVLLESWSTSSLFPELMISSIGCVKYRSINEVRL